ncbi:MAG TPA: extracellular solute-binding protein [Solirubrobacteraceae bacterium]|jgi:multiple sugar transport system substrate-binding protein|nr:extracellular solute-binding protein [Solirubrobacteraceae bacterium]
MWRAVITALALVVAAAGIASCGDANSSSSGPVTLNWFIFNEPSGAPQKIADRCSKASGGAYKINFEYLPAQADQQREQLVRRLGAEDDSLDLLGMDVVWTGEFANAGWLRPVPAQTERVVTDKVFDSVLQTARFEGRLYTVPIWSNTQLLWYRKDRSPQPPKTFDAMIDRAEKLGPKVGRFQIQANRYEGLVVLVNQLIESAGTSFLSGPTQMKLDREPTERALAILGRMAHSPAAAPNLTTSTEDTARLGFEAGDSTFMINYPFVYPSAKQNAPSVFEVMAAAQYPQVDESKPSKPPIGGINIGVSAFSKHPDQAFAATQCLIKPDNQLEVAKLGGLPPVRSDVYDRPEIDKIYPGFADVIRDSIQSAAPRPSESPAYQDLSLAIQRAIHPPTDIDPKNPGPAYDKLRDYVEKAIKREGLL